MNIPNHINSIPDDEYVTITHNKGQVEFSVPAKDLKALLAPQVEWRTLTDWCNCGMPRNVPGWVPCPLHTEPASGRSISAQVTEEYRERQLPLK